MNRHIGVEDSKYGVTANPLLTDCEGVTSPSFVILGPPPYIGNGLS